MRISDWSSDVCSSDLEVAELVVDKLWRQFVSEQPDAAERRRLAALFRAAGYETRPLLAALPATEAFWAPENRRRLVNSPVDPIVGTLRLFALPGENAPHPPWARRRPRPDPFPPP